MHSSTCMWGKGRRAEKHLEEGRKPETIRLSERSIIKKQKRREERKGQGERAGELGTKGEETGEVNGRQRANEQAKKRETVRGKTV